MQRFDGATAGNEGLSVSIELPNPFNPFPESVDSRVHTLLVAQRDRQA